MAESVTQTLIVKLHLGTEIRRFTSTSDLTWSSLTKRVVDSFELAQAHKFKLTYVDDEGDVITISTADELAEAIGLALKSAPPVLRLTIAHVGTEQKTNEKTPTADAGSNTTAEAAAAPTAPLPPGLPVELAPFLATLAEQLPAAMASMPEGLKKMIPRAELDLAATIAANTAEAAGPRGKEADPYCPAEPHAPGAAAGVHEGVTCDKSGVCPIVGTRYHLPGHNYDLCQAEFDKLTDKEKSLFRMIPPPAAPGGGGGGGAPWPNNVHPGVSCDRSGMCPILGTRYHLRGHNYDLCQSEFDKLPTSERLLYDAIPPPANGATGFATGGCPWRPGPWGWRGGGGGCPRGGGGAPKLAARFVRDVTIFDGTQMAPATKFTKIWRLKNVGEVAWPPGTRMLFVGGDQMTSEMSVPLSRATAVQPGEEVDVAVEMTAPNDHGRYLGYWRLTGPYMRKKFGQRVWCHVQVVDPAQSGVEAFDDLQGVLAEIEKKKSDLAEDDPEAEADEADAEATKETAAAAAATASAAAATAASVASAAVNVASAAASIASVVMPSVVPSIAAIAKEVAPMAGVSPPAGAAPVTGTAPAAGDAHVADVADATKDATKDETKDETKDGTASDDGVLVTDGMVVEAQPPAGAAPMDITAGEAPAASAGDVRAELESMGFGDATMLDAVLAKNGADVEACARDLAAASEWDEMLDDLAEMGFADRELNKKLMLKHAGNMKRTVRDLVES